MFLMIRADLKCRACHVPIPFADNPHIQELICGPTSRDTHVEVVAGKRARPRSSEILALAMERQQAQGASRLRAAQRQFLFLAQCPKLFCTPCNPSSRTIP